MRPRGEGNQDIEVEIAQFLQGKSIIDMHFCQYLTGLDPILFRGSEDRMITSQSANEFLLYWLFDSAQ